MKAIKITNKLKTDNPKLFKGFTIGSIRSIKIPKLFKRGKNIELAYDKREDLQLLDGWKEVVRPTLTEYQKQGKFIEVGDIFTYEVIDFTQEEIDAKILADEERPILALLQKQESDGVEFYNKVRLLVQKHYHKGTINDAQFKGVKLILEPALRPLKLGDWIIAQDNINAITRPTNNKLAQLYDFVKNKIDDYLTIKEEVIDII